MKKNFEFLFLKIFSLKADQEAWSELCDLYLIEHDYKKATFCAEELLLINPHNHLNHERYASIRYSDGDFEIARSYYFSALKLNPTNLRSLYGVLLTSNNLSLKSSSNSNRSNSNNDANIHQYAEQNLWAREQILQKYRENHPELVSIVELALQNLTV